MPKKEEKIRAIYLPRKSRQSVAKALVACGLQCNCATSFLYNLDGIAEGCLPAREFTEVLRQNIDGEASFSLIKLLKVVAL